jgi:3-oxoacyl-[acyl-carrier-protein] synthase III
MTAGILAIGMYAPPVVRRNDWWPPDVVARWQRPLLQPPTALTAGAQRVVAAIAAQAGDPFQGTAERRVLDPGLGMLDMEEQATRDALAGAAVDPAAIDLLLVHPVVADHQLVNAACPLHERLGLSPSCLALQVEATAYTSVAQLALAEAAIAAGRARYALLVQSCAGSRVLERDDPGSVLVGDGATALVMGPVATGRGVLATAHFTEGRYADSLIMSVPGGRWYDAGPARVHVADPAQLYAAHLRIADSCAEAIHTALARAGCGLADVDHLFVFEGTAWLQRVVYEHLGVARAPTVEIFQQVGYLSSAMLPAAVFAARQSGKLGDDDLVVLCGGGTGMTYGAIVMRWGAA